jgi:hypothetical protein
MSKAGMAVTFAGSNVNLVDPLGWAIRRLGYTLATFGTVTDADLAVIPADDTDQLLDLAEYRTLRNILGNIALVDTRVGPREEKLSQLAPQIRELLKSKWEQLEEEYGVGTPSLEAGVVGLDFMETTVSAE